MAKDKEPTEPTATEIERAEQEKVQAALDVSEAARVKLLPKDKDTP